MKKMTTIFVMMLTSLTVQAYTLSEIHVAYKTDTPLQQTQGTFDEALTLINSSNRNEVIRGKNILMSLKVVGELSENRRNAVSAAVDFANDRLDRIDIGR